MLDASSESCVALAWKLLCKLEALEPKPSPSTSHLFIHIISETSLVPLHSILCTLSYRRIIAFCDFITGESIFLST